jgi:hypothetical protein
MVTLLECLHHNIHPLMVVDGFVNCSELFPGNDFLMDISDHAREALIFQDCQSLSQYIILVTHTK